MSSPTANSNLKDRCFRVLREVSPAYGVLPKSCFLPGVSLIDKIPYAAGGFADIWEGQQDGNRVCAKVFQIQAPTNLDKIKRVCCSPLFRRERELNPIQIRVSIVGSWGGGAPHIRTSYPSSEFRRRCPRFVLSVLGCRTGTLLSTFRNIGGLIDYSWQAITTTFTEKHPNTCPQ